MTFLEQQDLVLYWLDDVDAGYFSRTQVKRWLNNAQQEVQKVLEQAFEGYFIRCVETTLGLNQREYELPTDFKRLHRIEVVLDGTTFQNQSYLIPDHVKCSCVNLQALPHNSHHQLNR